MSRLAGTVPPVAAKQRREDQVSFDERHRLANTLMVLSWASLLLLFVIGPAAFIVWAVLNTVGLVVRPSLPETFGRMRDERDHRQRLEADMRAAAAEADRDLDHWR
jgi:hypothetical protein